jgi:hypothetical protein
MKGAGSWRPSTSTPTRRSTSRSYRAPLASACAAKSATLVPGRQSWFLLAPWDIWIDGEESFIIPEPVEELGVRAMRVVSQPALLERVVEEANRHPSFTFFRLYEWDGHGTHERLVYSRDKRSRNVAPRPSAFSAVRSPPWARARSRAIASPRPVPPLACPRDRAASAL